jgi:ELWxxDGT repeat protein
VTKAVFEGLDGSANESLWVTNGTAGGTRELTPAGADSQGIFFSGDPSFSPDFTVLAGNALFDGIDASGNYNLWITDGTAAGTSELGVAGASSSGLFASGSTSNLFPDFTALGNKVLFEGADTNVHLVNKAPVHNLNLWVTDGTSSGTTEVAVAGASANGLSPSHFTVLGGKALFAGIDATNHSNLWVTDGTSAGTSELMVAGASFVGLLPDPNSADFTVFGGRALFVGSDTNDPSANHLWVTDGTSGGTSELTVAGANQFGLNPSYLAAFGAKVLFQGRDASGNNNLWITDGTSADTSELLVAGGYSRGLLNDNGNVVNPDFTILGSKALFVGVDASGDPDLWVTDGTSAGTSELAVAGASVSGLFWSDSNHAINPNFTVLGNKVLFAGRDANNKINLWLTDGTASGTSELVVAGASVNGLLSSGSPDFAVIGGRSLFKGTDARGGTLWVTDGTSAGTHELAIGLSSSDITVLGTGTPTSASSTTDFNGDRDSDILWQNDSGQVAIWLMNGTAPFSEVLVGANPGPSWQVIGAGDFNGDRDADILFQNTNGQAAIWLMNGTTPFSEVTVGANPGPSWQAIGAGDFNGDGDADILWQNTNGQAAIWLMNGTTPFSEVTVGANPGPSWHIAGTGDFNGDHDSDILWQNDNGQAAIWLINGTTPFSEVTVGANPGPSWHILGAGDYNGDGKSDILWQNDNGQASIWLMNGTTPTAEVLVGSNPGPTWHIR